MFGHFAATSRSIFAATMVTWLVVGTALAGLISYASWSLLELAIANPWSFATATSWRMVLLFVMWCVTEHQMHVWILHRKLPWPLGVVYQWHHREHHGMRINDFDPHIDNRWSAYLIAFGPMVFFAWRAIFYNPYAWTIVMGLAVTIPLHRYLWNHIHRGIHRKNDRRFASFLLPDMPDVFRGDRLEEHWLHKSRLFPMLERHHLLHHGKPNCNYSVVFAPYTDWAMGTLYGRKPWWKVRRESALVLAAFVLGMVASQV